MTQVARSPNRHLVPRRDPSTLFPSCGMLFLRWFVPVRNSVVFRARLVFGSRYVTRKSVLLPRAVSPQQQVAADDGQLWKGSWHYVLSIADPRRSLA